MAARVVDVFASRADLHTLLSPQKAQGAPRYDALTDERSASVLEWRAAGGIPGFMLSTTGRQHRAIYLIPGDIDVIPKRRRTAAGETWFSLHPKDLPHAVGLQHDGALEDGFIAPRVFLHVDQPETARFFGDLVRARRKAFTAVRSYHVRPEAMAALHGGARLAAHRGLDGSFDPRLPNPDP